MIKRSDSINRLISEMKYATYLEIGVQAGITFNEVRSARKIAVDPGFMIDQSELKGDSFALTSDDYFNQYPDHRYDIAFVDGHHTFEQSLRDFTRCAFRIAANGAILIDDCYPSDYYASLKRIEDCEKAKGNENWHDRNWMGDVYKTALFIHDYVDAFSFAFIKNTMGVVATWRQQRSIVPLTTSMREIEDCSYFTYRHEYAPRLPVMTIDEIIAVMKAG